MCKTSETLAGLSVEERAALQKLEPACHADTEVSTACAERLISLGLAELSVGSLDLTGFGKRAVMMMRR